ncbi:MAG: minor capsid protein [Ahrensia sp.]|nr:minor capsid protein [Ahrensia sp.]
MTQVAEGLGGERTDRDLIHGGVLPWKLFAQSNADVRSDMLSPKPEYDLKSARYSAAFRDYLRTGAPIPPTLKSQENGFYIWRTRNDGKVRPSHAANNGKIFSWDDPPPTGHPGEDFGCRCTAEPYVLNVREIVTITFEDIPGTFSPWDTARFFQHYFFGGGREVQLRETGLLGAVIWEFEMAAIRDKRRLPSQIAQAARNSFDGVLSGSFSQSYNVVLTVFSLGETKISGVYSGSAKSTKGSVQFSGKIDFQMEDHFKDAVDLGNFFDGPDIEFPRGRPFRIYDRWTADFQGVIYEDPNLSAYVPKKI